MSKNQTVNYHFLHNSKDSSLIFQFLLSEFLKSMEHVIQVEELLEHYQQSDSFHDLLAPLSELCGKMPYDARFTPWAIQEGNLLKLGNLIRIFVNLEGESKELKELQNDVEKGLREASGALELLRISEEEKSSIYFKDSIEKHLKSALKSLKKLPKEIIPILNQFKKNENVLFFLLRYQSSFRTIYSKRFLKSFLEKINPSGLGALNRFIVKEYSKRGFNHLTDTINEKMAELVT